MRKTFSLRHYSTSQAKKYPNILGSSNNTSASGKVFVERGNSLPSDFNKEESSNFTLVRKSHPQFVSVSLIPAEKRPGDDDKELIRQSVSAFDKGTVAKKDKKNLLQAKASL